MKDDHFTFKNLIHTLVKYSWLTIILCILGAIFMFFYSRHVGPKPKYTAQQAVFLENGKEKNYSAVKKDKALIDSYIVVANDRKIVSQVKSLLKKQHLNLSSTKIHKKMKIKPINGTLFVRFKYTSSNKKVPTKLINDYTNTFSKLGPRLLPSMPKPLLLSGPQQSKEVSRSSLSIPKKSALFGAILGFILGIFISLIIGIYDNYKKIKNHQG